MGFNSAFKGLKINKWVRIPRADTLMIFFCPTELCLWKGDILVRPPFCERGRKPAFSVKVYFHSMSHRQAATSYFHHILVLAGSLHAASDLLSEWIMRGIHYICRVGSEPDSTKWPKELSLKKKAFCDETPSVLVTFKRQRVPKGCTAPG